MKKTGDVDSDESAMNEKRTRLRLLTNLGIRCWSNKQTLLCVIKIQFWNRKKRWGLCNVSMDRARCKGERNSRVHNNVMDQDKEPNDSQTLPRRHDYAVVKRIRMMNNWTCVMKTCCEWCLNKKKGNVIEWNDGKLSFETLFCFQSDKKCCFSLTAAIMVDLSIFSQ